MTNDSKCTVCLQKKPFRNTVCKYCYYKYHCSFCRELTLKEACPGHEINTPTTNRFMEDKAFVNEAIFSVEK
jgi:hypothetical protein